ncbi:MAG: YceD family protein [Acidimicrobiia bacterium]
MANLRFQVSDLLGHPGLHRDVYGEMKLGLKVGETTTSTSAATFTRLTAVHGGLLAEGWSGVMADHVCVRCLKEWEGPIETEWSELFVRDPDNDQSAISPDGMVDLEPVVRDELSLALPSDPLCGPHCAGICPECGADLNEAPCDGHGEPSEGPFAALKQLFGP